MFLYDVERGEGGVAVIKPPTHEAPTLRQMHERRCFLLGIDRTRWDELWRAEAARIKAARAAAKKKGR